MLAWIRSRRRHLSPAALAIGLVAAAPARSFAAEPVQVQETVPGADWSYRIGPGDLLDVFVWKEPEISRQVTVRLDGQITVPLLGDITAAGRAPEALATEVSERLLRFVDAPHVTVGVAETRSARFYVMGQVENPGGFPFTGPVTVLQALAQAGGFVEFAKTDSIVIIGARDGSPEVLKVNYDRLESGETLEQNHALRPGDTVIVP